MTYRNAIEIYCKCIDHMTLEQLQRHRVKLIDAWRHSKAAYGFALAVKEKFYKIIESDSATGFFPSDPWLTHNLAERLDEVEQLENKLLSQPSESNTSMEEHANG